MYVIFFHKGIKYILHIWINLNKWCIMSRKSGNKWKTDKCGRCGNPHSGYSGKLDKNNVEYVVCQSSNKRMNVSGTGRESHSFAYPTIWELII